MLRISFTSLFIILFLFIFSPVLGQSFDKVYNLSRFGIKPNTGEDMSVVLNTLIQKLVSESGTNAKILIQFKKGRYDFHPENALRKEYYISNHDQNNPKTVGLALENLDNICLDGQGSEFIFHGRMLPISLINNENLTLKNIHIDFQDPQICQVKILENDIDAEIITFQTAPWVNYTIRDSVFFNVGKGWKIRPTSGIVFEEKTKRVVYNTGDIGVGTGNVVELSKGIIKAMKWKNPKLKPGMVIAMRNGERPHPGIFLHKGKNVNLTNVSVHYCEGMGLLAQLSENIHLDRFNVALRGNKDPRYFTAQADATHFSSCKGVIISNNGLYENMMDDAINIHGTYLKAITRVDDKTLIAKYIHGQSYGFDWGYAGDSVQFIQSKTMELVGAANSISSIEVLRENPDSPIREFKITFSKSLPAQVDPALISLGLENVTWTPKVEFTQNIIRNNRARGALFSTPKKTIVTNNIFDHTSGTAILLCGDCNGWYETGSTCDILISDNVFINALTSQYQFTNAVISIYPEIPDLKSQLKYFHSGIKIVNNTFQTFDKPLLYAKSVDGLVFSNNKITTNTLFPAFHWNKKEIFFERVINEVIKDNTINGMPLNYSN